MDLVQFLYTKCIQNIRVGLYAIQKHQTRSLHARSYVLHKITIALKLRESFQTVLNLGYL